MSNRDSLTASGVATYAVVVAAAVVTAAVVAPAIAGVVGTSDDDAPSVAVVTLRGGTSDANVNAVSEDLRDARRNASIEAVVLRVDSSGGPVDSSEEFYLAVNRTASEMPVVAYVEGSAASGGYFGIVPSNEIVVKPSSNVGSIGVIVSAPLSAVERASEQQESFVRSGPDKAQISKDGIREDIELLQSAFVGTVMDHRSDELALSADEVASGDVYLGTEAIENGFADRIGDIGTAIERAAALSDGIEGDSYDVTYFEQPELPVSLPFAGADIEAVDGNVVYVEADSSPDQAFVQPVTYYAVWGVPAEGADTNVTGGEVVLDG
jgi:protease-4